MSKLKIINPKTSVILANAGIQSGFPIGVGNDKVTVGNDSDDGGNDSG